jgi:recombination DNA repair RAD52 pathway protein
LDGNTTNHQAIDEIDKILTRPFPTLAVRERAGRGNTRLSYLEGQTVIRRLNEIENWSLEIKDRDTFTTKDKSGNETQVMLTVVALTIPGKGTREGVGVQSMQQAGSGGEDIVKGSLTDALKNAAKFFNIGLDLYGPDYERDDGINKIRNYIAKQPTMKEHMAEWIRESLNGELLVEQTTPTLHRLFVDLKVAFPFMDEEAATKRAA